MLSDCENYSRLNLAFDFLLVTAPDLGTFEDPVLVKKSLKKLDLEKKSRKKVNNVQGFQMPEMNDPFYTTPEILGIASGGQVKNDEQRRYAELFMHV